VIIKLYDILNLLKAMFSVNKLLIALEMSPVVCWIYLYLQNNV